MTHAPVEVEKNSSNATAEANKQSIKHAFNPG